MEIFLWTMQVVLDLALGGVVVYTFVMMLRVRSFAKTIQHGSTSVASLGGVLDDLESLIRESAKTAQGIREGIRSNREEIERRLQLLHSKKEDLEAVIDRAEECAARYEVAPQRPQRLQAVSGLPYDRARDLLAGGLAPEEVARSTQIPMAEIEVLQALRGNKPRARDGQVAG